MATSFPHLCSIPIGAINGRLSLAVARMWRPVRPAAQTEDRGFVMKTMTFTGKSRLSLLLIVAGLLWFIAPMARADEDKDPPTRVARISSIDGSVSLQPGGEGDWGSAARNRPMTIGDKIWADKNSRAELQAGQASIHIGSMTALSFLNLDENIIQMRLAEGSINFRVRELREGDLYEIDAPNLAFTVKQAGAFRIDVSETGDSSRVTVIRGEGEVTADGKTYEVHSGERAEFNGIDNVEYSIDRAPSPDGLDRWAEERDLREDNSVSAKYVSRDMPGYDDLDDNGTWRDEPEYGHVWYPREVAVGWAPYSYGYWNWVGPWGWTWVDYSPWGFAPYHYGRWNYIGGAWGWCPGPYAGYPIYGPAFVGFYGGGFGLGVGWFPLGFGEPFFPGFRCRHEFFERINTRNTFIRNTNVFNANVRNVNFVNSHNVNAVTVANRNTFVNGQAINRGAVRLTPAALRSAQVSNSVGLTPTQHSALGAVNATSRVRTPSAAVQNRAVIARTAPAQAASHMPVRTVNSSALGVGRAGNSPASGASTRPAVGAMNQRPGTSNGPAHNMPMTNGRTGNAPISGANTPRQRDLSINRPPSAMPNSARPSTSNSTMNNNGPQSRGGNSPRTWQAQGNVTDHGRAPAGFGNSNHPVNAPVSPARMNDANRPPWVRGSQSGSATGPVSRPATPNYSGNRPTYSNGGSANGPVSREATRPSTPNYNNTRPNYSNNGRSYEPPQRTNRDIPSYNNNRGNSQPRSYSAPPARTYSAPPSRSYSAPQTYSAPSRSYSAPSRSYSAPSGGGGGSRGSSGGGSHGGGGGGSPHGGGGSASHGRR
jgi:hypothetical protein